MRWLVLVLLALNVGLWAWNSGGLAQRFGGNADGPREPERLERQINPDLVRLLPATGAGTAPDAAPVPASAPASAPQAAAPRPNGASEPTATTASAASAPGDAASVAASAPAADR